MAMRQNMGIQLMAFRLSLISLGFKLEGLISKDLLVAVALNIQSVQKTLLFKCRVVSLSTHVA